MDKRVSSIKNLRGEVLIPADKSISHRAVMLPSLACGKSVVTNFSNGADCKSTLNLFKNLGVSIEYKDKNIIEINSSGIFQKPNIELNCGNSGTTLRLCSGILASQNFTSILYGDDSLSKRPMKRIIDPLTQMGAVISSNDFRAPLTIQGKDLNPIDYSSPIASAQVKSCILLAGLNTNGVTSVTEPYLSRNHTELMLKYMGADIKTEKNIVKISKSKLEPRSITVAGDISSAAYFIAAALMINNSDVIIKNVGLNPTRTGIIDVVKRMGGYIEILDEQQLSGELVGDIRVKTSDLSACEISGSDIPRLIDELPLIALLATQANGTTIIKDAQDLRKKESDRISTIVNALNRLGGNVEELADGFIIHGKTHLTGDIELDTYHDHRLAMTFYVAGLLTQKEILIKNFEWVDISFPEFEELFSGLF